MKKSGKKILLSSVMITALFGWHVSGAVVCSGGGRQRNFDQ